MNTLQQAETTLITKYFDVNINKKGTLVTLTLKKEYKTGKDVPIKKLRPNGQKVIETGIKYFQHYLGETTGKEVYDVRKKLYSMYTLLSWTNTQLQLSKEDTHRIQEKLSTMHINNASGLLAHYASPEGVETKKKLLARSKKWSAILNKKNSDRWKDDEYRKTEMTRRKTTGCYERSKKTMLKNYSDPIYRSNMLEKANKPNRKRLISEAAKSMWKRAKTTDIELFKRMANSCGGKKNFEINGIKMNSIEFLVAQALDELKIEWKYGYAINIESQTYIPDFILSDKKIIIECFGDYWHASPVLYEENQLLRKNVIVKDVWKKDQKRIDDFTSIGYTCLVFWETDIITNLDRIKQQIQNEYNAKN